MATSTGKPAGNAKKEAAKEAPKAAPEAKASSGDRKLMGMIAAFAVLSAGASAGAVFMVTRTQLQVVTQSHESAPARIFDGPSYPLGDFIVNLGSAESRRYLKASVSLGCGTKHEDFTKMPHEKQGEFLKEFKEAMDMRSPQMKDAVNGILSAKTPQELASVQGKTELKSSLMAKLSPMLPEDFELKNVYFTDFIIQ